jgi:hypothetical protein
MQYTAELVSCAESILHKYDVLYVRQLQASVRSYVKLESPAYICAAFALAAADRKLKVDKAALCRVAETPQAKLTAMTEHMKSVTAAYEGKQRMRDTSSSTNTSTHSTSTAGAAAGAGTGAGEGEGAEGSGETYSGSKGKQVSIGLGVRLAQLRGQGKENKVQPAAMRFDKSAIAGAVRLSSGVSSSDASGSVGSGGAGGAGGVGGAGGDEGAGVGGASGLSGGTGKHIKRARSPARGSAENLSMRAQLNERNSTANDSTTTYTYNKMAKTHGHGQEGGMHMSALHRALSARKDGTTPASSSSASKSTPSASASSASVPAPAQPRTREAYEVWRDNMLQVKKAQREAAAAGAAV